MIITQILKWIELLFFPQNCFLCTAICEEGIFCDRCTIDFSPPPTLLLEKSTLRFKVYSFLPYKEEFKKIIKSKFYGDKGLLVRTSKQYSKRFLFKHKTLLSCAILVPIPIHWTRKLTRGFNQANVISSQISQELTIVSKDLLTRTRSTAYQNSLKKNERFSNLNQAFGVCNDIANFKGRKVVLVDDLCTSGATLISAAKTLEEYNIKVVAAITLARV